MARYKWTPRAPLSTHATSCYPHGAPLPRIRPGEVSFLVSGNSCRRHRPGQSGTSSTSPSPFSSPGTFSSSCELVPLLDFDREPSPPQNHFAPEAPSAAKLTADDFFHPCRPNDHREDRRSLADPSRPSRTRGEPPFAGGDRRGLASIRAEEEEGGIDWSNLTSGPSGPTVSDPVPVHVGLSEGVTPAVCFPRSESVFPSETFSFLFYLNNRF